LQFIIVSSIIHAHPDHTKVSYYSFV